MVYDASVIEAQRLFNNQFYFVERQVIWLSLGLVALLVLSKLPTPWIARIGPGLFLATLVSLVLVLIPAFGTTAQGAQRWIRLGNLPAFQPSELAKLTTVLYLALWLKEKPKPLHLFSLLGLLMGLLILQPDLGTALIIVSTGFIMFFISGAPIKTIIVGLMAGLTLVAILIVSSPYRLQRVATFLDPTQDKLGRSYHINQALISLGSGGIFGLGLGRSRQKFQYLPEASTDSIFAVSGEETGLVGNLVILLLFGFLFYQLFKIALREPDDYRRILASGLTSWLGLQTVINIGAMVAIFPLTGVPLPFISYGGSSLIVQLATIGILLRIALTQK